MADLPGEDPPAVMVSDTATEATTPATAGPTKATPTKRKPTNESARDPIGKHGPPPGTAFALGWAMAQLYGPVPRKQTEPALHLPSVNELTAGHRLKVAFTEIQALAKPFVDCAASTRAAEAAWKEDDKGPFHLALKDLHQTFFETLVPVPAQLAAYQAGRALSDTCWLPRRPDEKTSKNFFEEFNPYRLATVRSSLQEAAGVLSPQSAAVASRSIQNWLDRADVNSKVLAKEWPAHERSVRGALLNQGTAWRAMLAGAPGSATTPSVQAWVQAGESVLRSTRTIVRRVVTRFWPLVLVTLAATGGLMYLAISQSQGTMRAWTGLVTALGSVGISTAGLKSGAQKVAKGIEQNVWNAASLDARAWEVTWLPPFPTRKRGPIRRFKMHWRGLAPGESKAGLEKQSEGPRPGE